MGAEYTELAEEQIERIKEANHKIDVLNAKYSIFFCFIGYYNYFGLFLFLFLFF